jgi:EAL domain-containing protein (putative c-di-GMP-specific phosphodiesterase class I)
VVEIDTWIVKNALRVLAEYRETRPDLRFSLNLSANVFETEDLAGFVSTHLEQNDVPPSAAIFEITESLAVRHLDHVEHQVTALRRLGCELALDDFGTGYSSFGYLQRLQFDYIKIDGCFVRDLVNKPVDHKMVRLIAEIGKEAGMRTTAEYVQSGPTLALLAELGVDMAQGYFIGRPTAVPTEKSMPIPINLRRRQQSSIKA